MAKEKFTLKNIKNNIKEMASSISTALAKVTEWLAAGPPGWAIAAASLAMIAAVIGTSIAISASANKEPSGSDKTNKKAEQAG
jgi:hypothetical protein